MKRKVFLIMLVAVMAISLFSGCEIEQSLRTGSSAPEVQNDRLSYIDSQIEKLKAKDISNVISFVETLSEMVGTDVLKDYATSYDSATKTVYVSADNANLAFYLDDTGNILFASASGTPAVKTALNQGIAKICIGTGISSNVQSLFNSVAETQWLNTINSNVIQAQVSGFSMDALDTTLSVDPTMMESLMQKEGYELTMPVLTTTLEEYGVKDLSNYYESPSLAKFWEGIDRSTLDAEIEAIKLNGQSIKEAYEDVTLEMPELEIDDWELSSYSLPSEFSDGTAVGTTSDAFDEFREKTEDWLNDTLEDEVLLQTQGWQAELDKIAAGKTEVDANAQDAMDAVNRAEAENNSHVSSAGNVTGDYESIRDALESEWQEQSKDDSLVDEGYLYDNPESMLNNALGDIQNQQVGMKNEWESNTEEFEAQMPELPDSLDDIIDVGDVDTVEDNNLKTVKSECLNCGIVDALEEWKSTSYYLICPLCGYDQCVDVNY